MSDDQADRVESLFHQAIDLPPDERHAFLEAHCGGDMELRAELETLLGHEQDAPDGFLEGGRVDALHAEAKRLADQPIEPDRVDRGIGEQFGQYRVVQLIGAGGMGAVYEAEQENPRRRVALKVLRYAAAMPQIVKRFEREAHLLARLQHPCIAHIYEAGIAETSHGPQSFFAMEYIDGRPLDAWATEGDRTIAERLEMIAQICDAVHHAHVCGVIHRDLKPGNILVDADERPRILDFGIARATEADMQAVTLQTEVGQLMGTVPYMSPEQVVGHTQDIDARSDVYSLGVLLYEVLSGRLPLDVRARSIPEAARIIQEEDPSHLSTINSAYRGDVDTIVAKALAKESDRRYQTAAQLADDIRRYLHDKPITARPVSTFYQLRKFALRNKTLVAVVALAFVMLSAATVMTARFGLRESAQRRLAVDEKEKSARAAYRAKLVTAQMALQTNDVITARRVLEDVEPAFRHTWEWKHLSASLDDSSYVLAGHEAEITSLAVSRDGRRIASADMEGAIRIWDLAHRKPIAELALQGGRIVRIVFLEDGERIVFATRDGGMGVLRVDTGETLISFSGQDAPLASMDVSPDESRIATVSEQYARLWDLSTGEVLAVKQFKDISEKRLVRFAGSSDNIVQGVYRGLGRWRPSSGEWDLTRSTELDVPPSAIDFGIDGRQIVTGALDKTVLLWDAETLESTRRLLEHTGPVRAVVFGPDATWFASGSDDQTIRIWNATTGEPVRLLGGHYDAVTALAVTPDGSMLVSGSADHTIRIWDIKRNGFAGANRVYQGHSSYVYDVAFDPTDALGRRVLSGAWDGDVRLWDTVTGVTQRVNRVTKQFVICLAFDPQGRWIAVGTGNPDAQLLDASTGELVGQFSIDHDNVVSVAFSPDGQYLAATRGVEYRRDGLEVAAVWNVATGEEVARYDQSSHYVAVASPTQLCIAALDEDAPYVFDAITGETIFSFEGHGDRIHTLSFSADGSRMLTASYNGDAGVWDARTGERIALLAGHTDRVYDAIYSPDGARIATCSNDNTIRIWNAHTFESLLELRGHDRYVYALAFSSDGSILVSASGDNTLRVWDTLPVRQRVDERQRVR